MAFRRAALLLAVFLLSLGCAHGPQTRPGPVYDNDATVGIVSAAFVPDVVLDLPAKGRLEGALKGAGRGFLTWAAYPLYVGAEGMQGCGGDACGYAAVAFLAVATAAGTVGAVVGGVQGALGAMPMREAKRIERATKDLASLRIQETMRDAILASAGERSGCRVIALPESGPSSPDAPVDNAAFVAAFAGKGVDSVLEVAVLSVGFAGTATGSDPPLAIFLKVRLRLYRAADAALIEERVLEHQSGNWSFAEWTADGAALMEQEFRVGYETTAEGIVNGWLPCPR